MTKGELEKLKELEKENERLKEENEKLKEANRLKKLNNYQGEQLLEHIEDNTVKRDYSSARIRALEEHIHILENENDVLLGIIKKER